MNISTVNELIASLESAGELSIREQKFLKLAKSYQQLAAENVALKSAITDHSHSVHFCEVCGKDDPCSTDDVCYALKDIPDTDRIVAGIKADGRVEGINFAASRLAAAFNHGFVDKPMAEVGDVVRMILTAKEDLANDPVLAADGLSGEYAEKSLAEWEAALREGADK
ncbi:hypothetical protein KP1KB2018_19880 [Klebsiella pneumoniae]|uniref:hypothetical protein n=1 Tax=Klebsiella pneumoniae TaxID=573 RepID=UPI003CF1386B